jgi:hypothetical protein
VGHLSHLNLTSLPPASWVCSVKPQHPDGGLDLARLTSAPRVLAGSASTAPFGAVRARITVWLLTPAISAIWRFDQFDSASCGTMPAKL